MKVGCLADIMAAVSVAYMVACWVAYLVSLTVSSMVDMLVVKRVAVMEIVMDWKGVLLAV